MKDDFLTKFRKAPRPEFAASLYQRINKPMKTKSKFMTLRFAALTLSMLVGLTALLFTPSVRALANTILGQFSAYIFVQGTPEPVQQDVADKKKTEEAQSKQNQDNTYSFAADAAAASQLAGFTVLSPAYVPEGFTPSSIDDVTGGWRVTSKWGGQAALVNFDNQAADSFLVIEELKIGQDHPITVERPEIVPVTVRGLPGAWVPDANDGKSILVWDENGITYSVISNKLPLEELQKIAESLGR